MALLRRVLPLIVVAAEVADKMLEFDVRRPFRREEREAEVVWVEGVVVLAEGIEAEPLVCGSRLRSGPEDRPEGAVAVVVEGNREESPPPPPPPSTAGPGSSFSTGSLLPPRVVLGPE